MDNMRIFDTFAQGNSRKSSKRKGKGKKSAKKERPAPMRLSAQEIRDKVASNSTKKANKPMKGQKLGVGFMDEATKVKVDQKAKSINLQTQKAKDAANPMPKTIEEKKPMIKPEATEDLKETPEVVKSLDPNAPVEDEPVIGDVKKNDPNDPNTKEKLKSALSMGAFDFGEKERAVLSQILGDQN